ncbi:MAG: L,D-transpeptidase [Candidatus Thiodiazotropha sp.]
MISINNKVGKGCANNSIDVKNILNLLSYRKGQSSYSQVLHDLIVPKPGDSDFDAKLVTAIKTFQAKVQKLAKPDGIVSPTGGTILFLGGIRLTGKTIVVDLDDQNLFAYEGNKMVYRFYCTSGDQTHPTARWPEVHKVFRKHKEYRSKKYDAQMNYAMFFTLDGKAIHQAYAVSVTSILKDVGMNSFGSHGCVRLSEANAETLFSWTPMSTTVFIDLEKI